MPKKVIVAEANAEPKEAETASGEIVSDSDETIEPQSPKEEPEPTSVGGLKVEPVPEKPKRKYTKKTKEEQAETVVVKKAVMVKPKPKKPVKPKVEKVIYVVEKEDGDVEEVKRPPKKLSAKERKAQEIEAAALKAEVSAGKQLARKKSGAIDGRSMPKERSEAQKAATARLVEMNRKKREDKLKAQQEGIKESVKEVLVEAVKNPKSLSSRDNTPVPQRPVPTAPIPIPRKKTKSELARELLG